METQLTLLTHHQPNGWSPALAKGGYMLGPSAHCCLSVFAVTTVRCGYTLGQSAHCFLGTRAIARVPYIRPLQGRGTVAPAHWWWVSSPGCVSLQGPAAAGPPSAQGLLPAVPLSALCKGGGIHAQHGWWVSSPGCVSLQSQRSWHPTAADKKKEGPAPLFFHSLFFFNIPSSRAPTADPTAKEARYMGQLWTTPNTKMPP